MNIEYTGFPSLGFQGKNLCVMFLFVIVSFLFFSEYRFAVHIVYAWCIPRSSSRGILHQKIQKRGKSWSFYRYHIHFKNIIINDEANSTVEHGSEEEDPHTPVLRRSDRERRLPERYSPSDFCSNFSLSIL